MQLLDNYKLNNIFMRTNLLITILLMTTVLLFCQCSKTEFEDFPSEELIENFPKTSKQLGLAVAKEINGTIRNLHKQGVDYSKANETAGFRKSFYADFFKASPSTIKTKGTESVATTNIEEFMRRVNNLTKIQIDFINRIIKECSASTSDFDFYNKLITINNDIYTSVPEIQQERLFNITSILYYGMKEIRSLEFQGLMISTPRSNMQHLLLKTKSEPGGGSFGETCRNVLAVSFAAAVATPIPGDEVIVGVTLIGYIAALQLYEYIVCTGKKFPSSDHEYCMRYFEECGKSNTIPYNQCEQCYRYCMSQGFWNC